MSSFSASGSLFDSHSARGSRTPCPDCGRVGTMTLCEEWKVKTDLDFSLAGVGTKFPATLAIRVTCGAEDVEGCGWNTTGGIEGGKLVVREFKCKEGE